MLKFMWHDSPADYATWNLGQVEDVELDEFAGLLEADAACQEWDSDMETHVVE
jgi:hypothetical protein